MALGQQAGERRADHVVLAVDRQARRCCRSGRSTWRRAGSRGLGRRRSSVTAVSSWHLGIAPHGRPVGRVPAGRTSCVCRERPAVGVARPAGYRLGHGAIDVTVRGPAPWPPSTSAAPSCEAGVVDADGGSPRPSAGRPPPAATAEGLFADVRDLLRGRHRATPAPARGDRGRLRWADDPGWRGGDAAQHPPVAAIPAARPTGGGLGLPSPARQRRQGTGPGGGPWGAAEGERDYIAIVVSTGVGGGIVLDGRLLDGADGNAGHIGHLVIVPLGRRCACGARGCLEAEVSGTAMAALTGAPAQEAPPAVRVRAGRLLGRAVASVATSWTSGWRSSPGRSPSGSARRSSMPPTWSWPGGAPGVLAWGPHRPGGLRADTAR